MYNIFPKNKYIFLEQIAEKKVVDEEDIFFFQKTHDEQMQLFALYTVVASAENGFNTGDTVLVDTTMVQTASLEGLQLWFCSLSGVVARLEKK